MSVNPIARVMRNNEEQNYLKQTCNVLKVAAAIVAFVLAAAILFSHSILLSCLFIPAIYVCYEAFAVSRNITRMLESPLTLRAQFEIRALAQGELAASRSFADNATEKAPISNFIMNQYLSSL